MQEISITAEDRLSVASLSDVGCVRSNNEDSLGVFPSENPHKGVLLVVADGMGGAAAGEVASRLAVEAVAKTYFHGTTGSPGSALQSSLVAANEAIHEHAEANPEFQGMGTTCTAVAVIGREFWFAHVGDSRAYLAVGGDLVQVTQDHSLAAEFERQGGGAPAQARNMLTRCLGVRPVVEVDCSVSAQPLPNGGTLVLCSDGLTNLVQDGEILQFVTMHRPDAACRRLIQLARERGAPDNVSVAIGRHARD
ncbi:MAG: serine/threonine-protein phosphatase [Gemmatimonadetes bacterium]|nr:serine/threonine-protein phosphatase [Gemmatimonadota bacterium]